MFVKITNGQPTKYPYTVGDLRKDNPNVSFPKVLSAEQLTGWGVMPVTVQSTPSFNSATQRVDTATMPTLVNGAWTIVKTVVDKTAEQIAADNENKAATIREQRDRKLAETDWTQVADAPVDSTVWSVYRQSLRDIPSQEGFPQEVTWPDQPE
jgi:hypothetical protein